MEREYRPAGSFQLRHEDIAQDGRPLLHAIPPALGSVWRVLLKDVQDADVLKRDGVLPILSRIRLDVTEHVVSPFRPFSVEGFGERVAGTAPDYTRVLYNIHARVSAKGGHAMFSGSPDHVAVVGTMFAEHVLTRPFAEKDRRRVVPEDVTGAGVTLDGTQPFLPARSILEEPIAGAIAVDPAFVQGDVPLAMGLMHTDANQHVNSLVYPRLFEEAVLRRLHALGRSLAVRARSLEIGYRRPSFAGDVIRVDTRLFDVPAAGAEPARIVALGVFVALDETGHETARVFSRLTLSA